MDNRALVCICIMAIYMSINGQLSNLKKDVRRTENKLDLLLGQFNLNYMEGCISEELVDEIKTLLEENKTIKAVKLLRDESGMNLIDAKEYVDNIKKKIEK